MTIHRDEIAIIGAGLGGCALALALTNAGFRVKVFEARPVASETFSSGVSLTPNGLHILEKLGVLARIKDRCYLMTHRTVKNEKDETVSKVFNADDSKYGYCNHRLWRRVLLEEMRAMLQELSVSVEYQSKFHGIISEDADGVRFRINESTVEASFLVGCDGIHSTVRRDIAGVIVPEYTGVIAAIGHIRRASVIWPTENYERNATLQGPNGAIFYLPEDREAKDIMVAAQIKYDEQSREDLAVLNSDKDRLAQLFRDLRNGAGPLAQQLIDQVIEEKSSIWIWPHVRMPAIPRWYSEGGKTIIIGDAAHALPPSSSQGVNQALEDAYSLAAILQATIEDRNSGGTAPRPLRDILTAWQRARQSRIDAIFEWVVTSQNVRRLPAAEREKLEATGKVKYNDDMTWLYTPRTEDEIRSLITGN